VSPAERAASAPRPALNPPAGLFPADATLLFHVGAWAHRVARDAAATSRYRAAGACLSDRESYPADKVNRAERRGGGPGTREHASYDGEKLVYEATLKVSRIAWLPVICPLRSASRIAILYLAAWAAVGIECQQSSPSW
jgi:hypothetical protein